MMASGNSTPSIKASCRRCGTCCRKGGPALHVDDKVLVETGKIPAGCLYTIRQGEPVYDNVLQRVHRASTDIIKIKGDGLDPACLFYEKESLGCKIYEDRPLECRVLECWNPVEIQRIYSKSRLTRKDLLHSINGLWDLIEAHHQKCNYDIVVSLIPTESPPAFLKVLPSPISEMLSYDKTVRSTVLEKGGIDADLLDFLFGTPLMTTLHRLGLRISQKHLGDLEK